MARFLPVMVQVNSGYVLRGTNFIGLVYVTVINWPKAAWRSVAVQTLAELIICHCTKVCKRADAGIRVYD
jgi:hypothetical protein